MRGGRAADLASWARRGGVRGIETATGCMGGEGAGAGDGEHVWLVGGRRGVEECAMWGWGGGID